MAPLFLKGLNCFYCGRWSANAEKGPIRKWQCKHCEAVNYLDEKGEITDPPVDETNSDAYGVGESNRPFESVEFTEAGLFCSKCIRNQHLFTTALASYFPATEDPTYPAYEREFPKFRKNLEERYPQVCDKCEPLVKARIRQTGYEAKADHLRRMMDRSKAGRAARRARNRNWRSWLVSAGAIAFWGSVAGQLLWDVMSALAVGKTSPELNSPFSLSSLLACADESLRLRRIPTHCSFDLAPHAGIALVAGIVSLWWNPKLRLKVEGRGGRFAGLSEYYKVQLIVMVVRCAFWAVLKDPSSSGLQQNLPPALHLFMIVFTLLSLIASRRIIQYDTRPLVNWSEPIPEATPKQIIEVPRAQSSDSRRSNNTPSAVVQQSVRHFPIEKLATPRAVPDREPFVPPTPPSEVDDMDWTPSLQRELRPTVSVYEREQQSVLDGPLPFHGSLPPAPQPPAWTLRKQPAQKPVQQVVERNPFHQTPTQSTNGWQQNAGPSEPVFAQPKFFPMSDRVASTGLETLFDQAFTIKAPEDDDPSDGQQAYQQPPISGHYHTAGTSDSLILQSARLGLLLISLVFWLLSQYNHMYVPGNYIEVFSLGSASLISGFALLECLKRPLAQWNAMEILVYIAELAAAVHLGGNLPGVSFAREYFDRYGKLLLIFMAAQEAQGLLSLWTKRKTQSQPKPAQSPRNSHRAFGISTEPAESPEASHSRSFNSQASAPGLTYSPTMASFSFSSQQPSMHNQMALPTSRQTFGLPNSFSLESLKSYDSEHSDVLDVDSDTETIATTATTATTATNNTIMDIRYGRNVSSNVYSPRRTELGPGISGLSLEDKPFRRVTRSQTRQRLRRNK